MLLIYLYTLTQELNLLKSCMTLLFPEIQGDLRSFSNKQILLFAALYYLEMMRVTGGDFVSMPRYLLVPQISSGPMADAVISLSNAVVNAALNNLEKTAPGCTINEDFCRNMQELLVNCCNRVSLVSQTFISIAKVVIERYPQVFCCRSVLFYLLEIIYLLHQSCDTEYENEVGPGGSFTKHLRVYTDCICTSTTQSTTTLHLDSTLFWHSVTITVEEESCTIYFINLPASG